MRPAEEIAEPGIEVSKTESRFELRATVELGAASFLPTLPVEPPDAGLVATTVRADERRCDVTVHATHVALSAKTGEHHVHPKVEKVAGDHAAVETQVRAANTIRVAVGGTFK